MHSHIDGLGTRLRLITLLGITLLRVLLLRISLGWWAVITALIGLLWLLNHRKKYKSDIVFDAISEIVGLT